MAKTWPQRLAAVGQNLLTLEINTVVTPGLSAQKMPEVPLALHSLVQIYGDYLAAADFAVTEALLKKSASRVGESDEAATAKGANDLLHLLENWPFPRRKVEDVPPDASGRASDLTNGAETFEALQWAAWGALETVRAGTEPLPADPVVLSRIRANCRQIKEAALRLEQQNGPRTWLCRISGRLGAILGCRTVQQSSKDSSSERLGKFRRRHAAEPASPDKPTESRLFGATVEQTARALFQHPRPIFTVDPDVTILIRKAWDVGVERVCLQTVLQVDGDVLQAIGNLRPGEKEFLAMLHRQAVKESVTQWRSLFSLLGQLATDVGKVVFRA